MSLLAGQMELTINEEPRDKCSHCCGKDYEDFHVHGSDGAYFYILEETSCFYKSCCCGLKPWTMVMYQGGNSNGPKLLEFDRPRAGHVEKHLAILLDEA